MAQHYTEIISIDPNVRFGKPVIRGSRISVYDVLGWLASGMSKDQVIEDYPELTTEHVNACLAYAADREHKHRLAS